jgi:hypothetical protein
MTKKQCPLGDDCDLTIAWMAGAEKAKDRIRELEAKLAKVIAAYRLEAMRREDYSHVAFDQHLAELTGGKDE